jgi:hypothetical protein
LVNFLILLLTLRTALSRSWILFASHASLNYLRASTNAACSPLGPSL